MRKNSQTSPTIQEMFEYFYKSIKEDTKKEV